MSRDFSEVEEPVKSVEIEFRGQLDKDWADRLGGLDINYTAGGNTVLSGSLRDQSAVYGLLSSLGGLGLDLVSLTATDEVKTFDLGGTSFTSSLRGSGDSPEAISRLPCQYKLNNISQRTMLGREI